MKLEIFSSDLLQSYFLELPKGLGLAFNNLKDAEISVLDFSFYTSVAAVFSSKIEGEEIELDSYIKHRRDAFMFQPDYTRKIDDLYSAYEFAGKNRLNQKNLAEAHRLLSQNLIANQWQGKLRNQQMYVSTTDGRIEYVAAAVSQISSEMDKFYNDLAMLLEKEMTLEEVFFFAAVTHLVFVKIHPWVDGNGRTARMLEKWFLAEKLGEKAWFIQSERGYYQQHQTYYENSRRLGLEYPELDYSKALPFLLMLPHSLF
jgi:Fic family protein